MTQFHALEVSLELVRGLRRVLAKLRAANPRLSRQLEEALISVPLNLSEGRRRAGGDRRHHFRIAAGSADETRTCLRVAEALGILENRETEIPLGFLDRVLGMLWRLTR
jgi:four helix bundle protein